MRTGGSAQQIVGGDAFPAVSRSRNDRSQDHFVEDLRQHLVAAAIPRDDRMTAVLQAAKRARNLLMQDGFAGTLLDQRIARDAFRCALLRIRKEEQVLLVGLGSGRASTILTRLARSVILSETNARLAADHVSAMANSGVRNLRLETGGKAEPELAAIYVEGNVSDWPIDRLKQLRPGGRMVVRMGLEEASPARSFPASTNSSS